LLLHKLTSKGGASGARVEFITLETPKLITSPIPIPISLHALLVFNQPNQLLPPGIVLLKNKAPAGSSKPLLPLDKSSLRKLCVLGPLANSAEHMMGNYYGNFDAELAATPLQGIQEELGE
jgi:hypothetical protein